MPAIQGLHAGTRGYVTDMPDVTNAIGTPPHADPRMLQQLQQHRAHCLAARSRTHTLRGAAEAVHAFVSPRFVSTLAVMCLVLAALLVSLS